MFGRSDREKFYQRPGFLVSDSCFLDVNAVHMNADHMMLKPCTAELHCYTSSCAIFQSRSSRKKFPKCTVRCDTYIVLACGGCRKYTLKFGLRSCCLIRISVSWLF